MNIIILTGRFGMGHYSAATAIKQEIEEKRTDVNVEIIDVIEFLMPSIMDIVYGGFNILVSKWANLYNSLNRLAGKCSDIPFKSIFAKKIDTLIEECCPDLIISTLPLSSQYISAYKGIRNSCLPLYTFITDISTHNEWLADNTDLYFVGAEEVKLSLMQKGVPKEKIKVTGIPVKQNFKSNKPLSLCNIKKEILIMGGGLGLIPYTDKLLEYLDKESNIKATVITGNNKKMYHYIKNKYQNINVIGYTDKVYQFMQKADLVLTKAGGITMFEAIYSEIPLLVINPFLEQEKINAVYIEAEQIGKVLWNGNEDIISEIQSLLQDNSAIGEMKKNMRKVKQQISRISICDSISQLKMGVQGL